MTVEPDIIPRRGPAQLGGMNAMIRRTTGIRDCFASVRDHQGFCRFMGGRRPGAPQDRQWGDIQTPRSLADRVCGFVSRSGFEPDAILEPTYGSGGFLLAAIDAFPRLKRIYGIEYHKEYDWIAKAALARRLAAYTRPPEVKLHRDDVFRHRFEPGFFAGAENLLILGNPPWVTNSELSSMGSENMPAKSNFRGLGGMDALTGESNFDISEGIISGLLGAFSHMRGMMAMLCKRTVARNIVRDLPASGHLAHDLQIAPVDARREFGRSVDAVLFACRLGKRPLRHTCRVVGLESPRTMGRFGWVRGRFVADAAAYARYGHLDGRSHIEWRSGIKHDCAPVLEMTMNGGRMYNGLGERVDIEGDRVYPLVKGSMIGDAVIDGTPGRLLVTQGHPSEDTGGLAALPRTWRYLLSHSSAMDGRKSAVYGRRRFSVFGVGGYSFMPYKVAVCGMRSGPVFSVCAPVEGRPAMLDDTCYFLGFEGRDDAIFAASVLGTATSGGFLRSLSFAGSKRQYTKAVLERLDLRRAAAGTGFAGIRKVWRDRGFDGGGLDRAGYERFRRGLGRCVDGAARACRQGTKDRRC